MKFRNSRSVPLLQPFHFKKDSMTQEQFAYDCDINNIVRGMTAPLPINESPLSDEVKAFSPDMYEKALYTKASAENAFNRLPSDVRTFFDNNPAKMLAFVSDPANSDKCIELGLAVRKEATINDLNTTIKSLKPSDNLTDTSVTPEGSQGV